MLLVLLYCLTVATAVTGIAVGVTLGIFFIFAIILIGFIIYTKRFVTLTIEEYCYQDGNMGLKSLFVYCRASQKDQTDIQIHSMR